MSDDTLSDFLLHCPLLHKLKLSISSGLKSPVISSHNLSDLVLHLFRARVLTVNCPKLQTLKANTYVEDLTVNGMAFHELSSTIRGFQMEPANNFIELSLCSGGYPGYNCSVNRFLELMGTFRSLKVLAIDLGCEFDWRKTIAVPLLNLLSRLPNLDQLYLRGQLILEEAEEDSIAQALTYPLASLQLVEIEINKYDERELRLLGCLLQVAPALKEVKLQHSTPRGQHKSFFQNWDSLKKSREQGTITEEISLSEFVFHL